MGPAGADGFVDGALFELRGAAAEEAQFRIRIVAAVADPAAEEKIAAGEEVRFMLWLALEQRADFAGQFGADFFVGVEREHPVRRTFRDGGVFLRAEAFPVFAEEFRAEFTSNVRGAVGGAAVDDDDFVGPADAGEGARQVRFLIFRNDGDRECEWHGSCGSATLAEV